MEIEQDSSEDGRFTCNVDGFVVNVDRIGELNNVNGLKLFTFRFCQILCNRDVVTCEVIVQDIFVTIFVGWMPKLSML